MIEKYRKRDKNWSYMYATLTLRYLEKKMYDQSKKKFNDGL